MDNNEDMLGVYLGGGSIQHTVKDGDVYFRADDLVNLFWTTGHSMAKIALTTNDAQTGSMAYTLIHLAYKAKELKSELMKRDIEASFSLPTQDDLDDEFFDNNVED